jgi:hypothetical protein
MYEPRTKEAIAIKRSGLAKVGSYPPLLIAPKLIMGCWNPYNEESQRMVAAMDE